MLNSSSLGGAGAYWEATEDFKCQSLIFLSPVILVRLYHPQGSW